MKKLFFLFALSISQVAFSAEKTNLTVTLSPGFTVMSATSWYRAANDYLPFCAESYLGGNHHGKSEYKAYQITQLDEQTFQIHGQTSKPFSLACNYQYKASYIQIASASHRPCQYNDPDLKSCAYTATIEFNPETDSGANLSVSCEVRYSESFYKVFCSKN